MTPLNGLTPALERVLALREEGKTFEEIAEAIGKTRERARQMLAKAKRKKAAQGTMSFELLTVRAVTGLKKLGIINYDDLLGIGPGAMKNALFVENFGRRSFEEVLQFMGWNEDQVRSVKPNLTDKLEIASGNELDKLQHNFLDWRISIRKIGESDADLRARILEFLKADS